MYWTLTICRLCENDSDTDEVSVLKELRIYGKYGQLDRQSCYRLRVCAKEESSILVTRRGGENASSVFTLLGTHVSH